MYNHYVGQRVVCFFLLNILCFSDDHVKQFRDEGTWNYSTMLLREDLGLLIVGARDAIYALDVNNISVQRAKVPWGVTKEKREECQFKGKNFDHECRNYIRTLHLMDNGTMYVCGTNAFNPTCDHMTYTDGKLKLANIQISGRGKCPFDPFQRHSSVMVGKDLYSATSVNLLGSDMGILRSSPTFLRTEYGSSSLSDPSFVFMDLVRESVDSTEGDDDKVYVFFSEIAVEYGLQPRLRVSRVARVCKGDMGGERKLQKKWTSFLKAALECSVSESSLPFMVQDVFHLQHSDWTKSMFYAIFTTQLRCCNMSTVCAYSVSKISSTFSRGRFKTRVIVKRFYEKWVPYDEDVPVPRPGACINNVARSLGVQQSLDLPDKTLMFVQNSLLMDEIVRPLTGGPLMISRGAAFTRLVVDSVTGLDGHVHHVMFVGTENGFVQKAVNYNGEMCIIEEVQVFQVPEPVKILRLSSSTGYLYAGSNTAAVQMPLSDCGRYGSCLRCVLARDPYCAWDLTAAVCFRVPSRPTDKYVYVLPHTSATEWADMSTEGDRTELPCCPGTHTEDSNILPLKVALGSLKEHEERLPKVLDQLGEIKTVTNWPQPTNVKTRQSLGFCGYYCRFLGQWFSILLLDPYCYSTLASCSMVLTEDFARYGHSRDPSPDGMESRATRPVLTESRLGSDQCLLERRLLSSTTSSPVSVPPSQEPEPVEVDSATHPNMLWLVEVVELTDSASVLVLVPLTQVHQAHVPVDSALVLEQLVPPPFQ
ncbi:semaphorin-4E-like [Chanos chanos]|uniref:Semaphorin-4E-like n=1 Tax=Chanos chanos TaxID=29144 RepID=A0A6J2W3H5_CHACN|nr:semaphorin-4E-like [Chanos chanos]